MDESTKSERTILLKDPVKLIVAGDDKKRPFLDILKWIFGTLFLGGIGLWISYRHNTSDEYMTKYNADVKLITSINFDTSIYLQYRSLLNIQPFIITDEIKAIVNTRLESMTSLLNSPGYLLTPFNRDSAQASISLSHRKTELTQLISSADSAHQKPVSVLKEAENKIIGSTVPVLFDSSTLHKLFEKNAVLVNTSKDDYQLQGIPQTQWCKKGYYVEYNNSLRIGINDLISNRQTITVNFKDIEADINEPKQITQNGETIFTIAAGQTFTLMYASYRYQITLNYIGAAGKNPFTKAAYITVATYKKAQK